MYALDECNRPAIEPARDDVFPVISKHVGEGQQVLNHGCVPEALDRFRHFQAHLSIALLRIRQRIAIRKNAVDHCGNYQSGRGQRDRNAQNRYLPHAWIGASTDCKRRPLRQAVKLPIKLCG